MPIADSTDKAYPVIERIARELHRRLSHLMAGYDDFTPVPSVLRQVRLADDSPKHFQIFLTQGDTTRQPELDCPGNPPAIGYEVLFNIRCQLMPSQDDPTPLDTYRNVIASNVMRVVSDEAVHQNDTGWHTLGLNAINSLWQSHELYPVDGGVDGITVPLLVQYRHDENNPYNER